MSHLTLKDSGYSANPSSTSFREVAPAPFFHLPLIDALNVLQGTGPATFTRTTTGTFVDKTDGLIKSAAIDTARFETNGILIEGASTNLLLRSEEFDNASWSKTNTSVVADNTVSPDGTPTADSITQTSTNGTVQQTHTVDPLNKTFTFSVYLKASAAQTSALRIHNNDASESIETNFAVTTEWQRFSVTKAFTLSKTSITAFLRPSNVGGPTQTVQAWGAQLEELPFASSYIPTVASTVTRAADNLSVSSVGNFNESGGSISVDFDLIGVDSSAAQFAMTVDDGTSADRHLLVKINGTDRHNFIGSTSSVTQYNLLSGAAIPTNVTQNMALTYENNNVIGYVNKSSIGSDSVSTMPVGLTTINIGRDEGGSSQLFGHIKNVKTFNVVLTPTQVLSL